jgi:hypothetical protein
MKKIFMLLFVLMLALNFSACGSGGDGGGGASTETYSVQGNVMNGDKPVSNVTVTLEPSSSTSSGLSIGSSISTITDASGSYTFTGLPKGNYKITYARSGYTFDAASTVVTVSDASVTVKNCAVKTTNNTYSIGGRLTAFGKGLAGVNIALSGASSSSTTTNADGSYAFAGLANGDYTITPTGSFKPASAAVTISSADVTGKDFASSAVTYLHYTLPDQYAYEQAGLPIADEAAALFSGYTLSTGIDYGGGTLVSGYALNQFVDKAAVNAATPDPDGVLGTNDARQLYSVVVRSNQDGFSNRTKFYDNGTKTEIYNADLKWDQFIQGYLLDLNYSGKAHYPGSVADPPTQVKMYNIKYAYDLYMFRKIDVKRPDAAGSLATFEVAATTDNYVDDTNFTASNSGLTTTKFSIQTLSFGAYTNVRAIPLTQFLTDYVTNAPASYTYKIAALDDTKSQTGWTYTAMQQAYYLPDHDFVIQVAGGSEVAGTKINFPVRIELISASAVEYDYSAKNPPAYAKAYDE